MCGRTFSEYNVNSRSQLNFFFCDVCSIFRSSPLERRKTSPARLDGNPDLPEIVDQDEDQPEEPKITDFVISKSLLKPSHIEPLKDTSSDNVVGRQRSFRERFFPDLEKKKNKHKKANSVSSSYSLTKSPVTSPKTSPKVAKDIIVHPQNAAGWTTERNKDGNVIHIRKSNGERVSYFLSFSRFARHFLLCLP